MSMAIMQLRLQTLSKQINKNNFRLRELQDTLSTLSLAYTNNTRLYKQCYLMANGIIGSDAEEFRETFTVKLDELEPEIRLMDNKAETIEAEISAINSELAAETQEFKDVQKWIESNAKKETAHYSMS